MQASKQASIQMLNAVTLSFKPVLDLVSQLWRKLEAARLGHNVLCFSCLLTHFVLSCVWQGHLHTKIIDENLHVLLVLSMVNKY